MTAQWASRFGRLGQRSGGKGVLVLWAAALATAGSVFVGLNGSAAWGAAPSNDGIIPTANDLGTSCQAGLAADEICQTDNSTVTYYMDSNGEFELETVDRQFVIDAMARYRDDTTALTITYDSSPSFEGAGETDVVYQEGDFGFPESYSGVTWCNDPEDGTTWLCDQSYIRMRGAGRINAVVATHETGHSFGFLHGNEWAPARTQCDSVLGIMRADEACIPNAALGTAVINNIDWVYG